jgi:uncharacterized protein (TIGR03435 family)
MRNALLWMTVAAVLTCGSSRTQDSAATKPMAANADPGVEVATIKPTNPDTHDELFTIKGRHIVTINTNLNDIIKFAYGLSPKQIEGLQPWMSTEKFDIDAVSDVPGEPNNPQMQIMMRKILADRFGLIFHREKKELPVYTLSVAKGGPKLTRTERKSSDSTDFYGPSGMLTVNNASMQDFATGLSRGMVNRPVVDRTNLEGRYDFVLRWTPEDSTNSDPARPPAFYTAFEEQLGLKLEPSKALIAVLVIDRIKRPSIN